MAYNGFGVYEVLQNKIWVSVVSHKHRVMRTRKGSSFAKQSGEFVHGTVAFAFLHPYSDIKIPSKIT
jgi:hypothetical protein